MNEESNDVDLKGLAKHFLPAILALLVALTGWLESHTSISNNIESFEVYKVRVEKELEQVKLNEAELKGELKYQQNLTTDLRMDIREIKTILESMAKDKKSR